MAQDISGQPGGVEFHAWMENRSRDGKQYLDEYIAEVEITESIDSPSIYARISIDDSGDLITSLDGGEMWNITIKMPGESKEKKWRLQTFKISDFVKQEKRALYVLHLASEEFIRNELCNLFGRMPPNPGGSSKGSGSAGAGGGGGEKPINELVCDIMTKTEYKNVTGGMTKKKVFTEKTEGKIRFIACNWRPFNAINWLCEKSIRSKKSGSIRQSGFIFYENYFGFHFTSLDQLIEDSKKQPKDQKFQVQSGSNCGNRPIPCLYKYKYAQKATTTDLNAKDLLIDKLTFPKSYSLLDQVRHGTLAGFVQGFDPVELARGTTNDKSKDVPVSTRSYTIEQYWNSMAHVEKEKPYKGAPNWAYDFPRRNRLKPILSFTFGKPNVDNPKPIAAGGATFQDIIDCVSYSYLRLRSFMYQQLSIQVPGNTDLFAGYGIEVEIPKTLPDKKSDTKLQLDKRWSGKWMLAGVTHRWKQGKLITNCLLVRDSTIA